jgi:hypothetical protein
MSTEQCMGYVTNNYSQGMVQVRLFGQHDGGESPENFPWCHVDQGTSNPAVAGVGEAHALQTGVRVKVTSMGGKDSAKYVSGTAGRSGSGQSGGGGLGSSSPDNNTACTDINWAQSDFPIPAKNPNSPNGTRVEAKPLDGRYNEYAGGQPCDLTNQSYPTCKYKDA